MPSEKSWSKLFVAYVTIGALSRIVGNLVNMMVSGISFAVILTILIMGGEQSALAFFAILLFLFLFMTEWYNGFRVMATKSIASRRFTKILLVTRAIWVLGAFGIIFALVLSPSMFAMTAYPNTLFVIAGLLIFGNLPMLILHALELRTFH